MISGVETQPVYCGLSDRSSLSLWNCGAQGLGLSWRGDTIETVGRVAGIKNDFSAVGGARRNVREFQPGAEVKPVVILHCVGLVGDGAEAQDRAGARGERIDLQVIQRVSRISAGDVFLPIAH